MSGCVVALTKIAMLSKSVTESQKHVNSLPELIQYLQVWQTESVQCTTKVIHGCFMSSELFRLFKYTTSVKGLNVLVQRSVADPCLIKWGTF